MKSSLCYLLIIFVLINVWACQEDENVITISPAVNLKGYVQKGPFINGTTLIITELDDSLAATGKTFTTQITDNKGTFGIKTSQLDYQNLQLIATGFYFDEVKGEKSSAQLTLFALADVSATAQINVNVLSHLEKERVMYLINQGKSFMEAKKQAQHEILAIFRIEKGDIANSESLDISQEGEDNAILLAISAILQGNNSVAELSELLADITFDIREDGTLNSEKLKDTLKHNAINLNMPQIRQNVQLRYEELGVEAMIPNFEKYIDSDGDGILNKDEDDTPEDFTFATQEYVAINTEIISNEITISGISDDGYITANITNGNIIKNNETLQDSIVNLVNGDKVKLKVVSSQQYSQSVTAVLSLGILNKTFEVITDDYTPDEFVFVPMQSATRNTTYISESITLSDLPHASPAIVTDGILLKNEQEMEGDTVYVTNGDKLQLQIQSSSEWNTAVAATIQIGGYTTNFSVTTEAYPWSTMLSGMVQVGPFTGGSSITLSELDSTLNKTSTTFTTTTSDNKGAFQLDNTEFDFPWALLEAKGYYFNMVSGKNSDGELQLTSYSDVSSTNKMNTNVLTHLESRRVKYLFNNGMSFTDAKKQALQEVLKIFEINETLSTTAEDFDIAQNNTESAILIATSVLLHGYESTGTLYSLLNDISTDLETDGILSDGTLGSALVNNAYYADLPAIRQNLINKYKDLGITLQVPDFEKYIQTFKQNTSFEFTKPIVYPSNGSHGVNLLAGSKNSFKAGQGSPISYSMVANVPENTKLKIILKGGMWYYSAIPAPVNWSVSTYDNNKKSQVFTITKPGMDSDIRLDFPTGKSQTITIEYYEYGSTTPTKTKTISVTP